MDYIKGGQIVQEMLESQSNQTLFGCAGVVESVDTRDLKSLAL